MSKTDYEVKIIHLLVSSFVSLSPDVILVDWQHFCCSPLKSSLLGSTFFLLYSYSQTKLSEQNAQFLLVFDQTRVGVKMLNTYTCCEKNVIFYPSFKCLCVLPTEMIFYQNDKYHLKNNQMFGSTVSQMQIEPSRHKTFCPFGTANWLSVPKLCVHYATSTGQQHIDIVATSTRMSSGPLHCVALRSGGA